MKRIMLCLLITLSCLFSAAFYIHAEASDYYIGNYRDGSEAYLVTDTIHETLMSHNGYFDGYKYDCKVKSVFPDTREYYSIDYTFYAWTSGLPQWKKDGIDYYARKLKERDYPVEFALHKYFFDYSMKHHPNQWKSEKVLRR